MGDVEERAAVGSRISGLLPGAVIGLAIAAAAWVGVSAQTAPSASSTQTASATTAQASSSSPAATPKKDPEDEVICKTEEGIGSRLNTIRICHTKREWKQMSHDSADWLNDPHRQVVQPH